MRSARVIKRLLAAGLCLLLCAGCGQQGEAPVSGAVLMDSDGNRVVLPAEPRVVCAYASFAQCWLLAGLIPVGVTQDAIEERDLELPEDTVVVGTTKTVDPERIAGLSPDYVMLSADLAAHRKLEPVLKQMGIPCGYFRVDTFAEYAALMGQLCAITGRQDLYEKNVAAVERGIEEILGKVPGQDARRALLLRAYSSGAKVKGTDILAGQILQELGVGNIALEIPSLLEDLSVEEIIRQDPDLIFVVPMGDQEGAGEWMTHQLLEDPAWAGLTALQEGRVYLLPQDLFHHKPNHRWKESYAYLAEILYPDLF